MPSQYVQAKHCQLFQTDLEDLLLLPTRIILCGSDANKGSDGGKADSCIALPTLGGALSAVLTEVHTRASIENALVRVFVPKSKQDALLLDNPYVQLYQQRSTEQAEGKKEAADAGLESSVPAPAQRPPHKEMLHRVGRVVALLPKPKITNQGTHSGGMPPKEDLLSSWLLAVHLGERVELFSIKCVSNEVLSEPEHLVYLQSTLGKYTSARTTAKQAASNTSENIILSGERVEAVKKNLKDLRVIFEAVRLHQQQTNGNNSVDPLQKLSSHLKANIAVANELNNAEDVPLPKRARTDGTSAMHPEAATGEAVEGHGNRGSTHQACEEAEAEQTMYFGAGKCSQAVRLSRLSRENEHLTQQLDLLRQMLQSRDDNLALVHKQLRQAEEQHKSELSQWRLKEIDESKAHERMVVEYHAKLKENETLLQKADQKLRELAKMTVKYKGISDEVMRRMGVKGKNPEEILALLKDDKSPAPF